jgi:hypothetical protein
MSYKVFLEHEEGITYGKIDSDNIVRVTCNDQNDDFQEWLYKNQNNLPADIQAKVDNGDLVITDVN